MAAEVGLGHQCWHQPMLGDGGLATPMVLVSPSACQPWSWAPAGKGLVQNQAGGKPREGCRADQLQ